MLEQIEGSQAVARAVAASRPQVVCAHPITPQTHIVEALGRMVRAGDLQPCSFLNVESEFAALSVCIGAPAAGSRAYTATASQGLLFMTEAVYNAAGLGLPIVMTVANRAVGAPINIWNDHSDAMALRDAGWIPAGDSARIVDALSLLRRAAGHEPIEVGRVVAVYGGGDTALDAARTARRLGATDTVVVYRRNRDRMPAHTAELEEATAEGIRFRWLSAVRRADGGRLVLEKMSLDGSGRPVATGETEEMPADMLVLALGQDSDLSLVAPVPDVSVTDGVIDVTADLMTGRPGIFAGGDAAPGERSATKAVGHGARAARRMDDWLAGRPWEAPAATTPVAFEELNTWYYSDAPRAVRPELEAARRVTGFEEVVGGLDERNALFEARRCMSCGNCLECDNCYGVCPDNAVVKLSDGLRYRFDYDYCKGCGICAAECPCGAILMEPEEI